MKSIIVWTTVFLLGYSSYLSSPILAQTNPTRIQFAKGSYCGSYSGDFSQGKQFVLNLSREQTFTINNFQYEVPHDQYNVFVSGPTGYVEGRYFYGEQINYYIPVKGEYYVYIESTTPNRNNVEFCAY